VAPFAAYLQQCVAAAAPDWIPATVLWREIREKGFDGSERTVRNFVATLRPVREPDPLVRFETAAGDQMQVDWIEFRRRRARACSPSSLRSATTAPAMSSSFPTCGSIR
jgi:transposase